MTILSHLTKIGNDHSEPTYRITITEYNLNKLTKTQNTHTASTKTKLEHQNDINNTLFDYWFFEPLHMPAGVGTAVLKSSVLHQSPGCRLGMSKRQTHIQSQMIIKKR